MVIWRMQSGIVDASRALCLRTLLILLLSLLHSDSERIISLRRYSIAGYKTWLMMYLACLSVIFFQFRSLVFVVTLFFRILF